LVETKLVKMKLCTGAIATHNIGRNMHWCNQEVIFDDVSPRPDFSGGRGRGLEQDCKDGGV